MKRVVVGQSLVVDLECDCWDMLRQDLTRENIAAAEVYEHYALAMLRLYGPLTTQDLYQWDILDIPLYMALHSLHNKNLICGDQHYHDNYGFHDEYHHYMPQWVRDYSNLNPHDWRWVARFSHTGWGLAQFKVVPARFRRGYA